MSSYSYSRSLIGRMTRLQSRFRVDQASAGPDRAMYRLLGWAMTIAAMVFLFWQLDAASPFWPRAISAALLVVISVLAGMRIGADSVSAFLRDARRLNKVLAEQNRELTDANAMLVEQLSCKIAESTSSN